MVPSAGNRWCLPAQPCWPNASSWDALNASVGGALSAPGSAPYCNASAMEYVNWKYSEGHQNSPLALPALAVTARSAADVAAAVRFAASVSPPIRLAVKSTGHTYTGRSTAAGALLVYLHSLRAVEWSDAFDDGCGTGVRQQPAVTVQPGLDFGTLYPLADARGYTLVGGGGSTVGAAGGYVLGGGHSVLSRSLGLGADNVLSFDLVAPNGTQLVVSPCASPDLFWALRGGGGGTFGIVTSATHRLHPAPPGGVVGLKAKYPMSGGGANVSGWLAAVIQAQPALATGWGCYYECLPVVGAIAALATWDISCLYYGADIVAATAGIAPLKAAFVAHPARMAAWALTRHASFWAWKSGDHGGDTSGVASALTSRIFPSSVLSAPANATALAATILDGVGKGVNMQIALVLGGAAGGAHSSTAVSSHMRHGMWHVVGATGWVPLEPDALQRAAMKKVRSFGDSLRKLAPASGAYLNENDWLEPGWQDSFFGGSYARLLATKRSVDVKGLLECHQCVGSHDTVDVSAHLLDRAVLPNYTNFTVKSDLIAFVPGLIDGAPYSAEIFYPAEAATAGTSSNNRTTGAGQLFPLVVFAHGTGGGSLVTYQTDLRAVAQYGFIVMAPMSCPLAECYSSYSYDQLATAVSAASMGASLHPALAAADFSRIGVYGHSMGAMATMLSAAYASKYQIGAAVCQHTCIDAGTVGSAVQVPIMYTTSSGDTICPSSYTHTFYDQTHTRKVLWEIEGSSHFEPCDTQGALREIEPSARFLACELRGERCDEVYGASGQAICSGFDFLKSCKVSDAARPVAPGR